MFDYHLTNPNPAFHDCHFHSFSPFSSTSCVFSTTFSSSGIFSLFTNILLLTSKSISTCCCFSLPQLTLSILASWQSQDLLWLFAQFHFPNSVPFSFLWTYFTHLFSSLFLPQLPSIGTFLSAASYSNFCSPSFSSCSISRSRLDHAPIKKQASKNPLGQDFNDSYSLPFMSNRKTKEKRQSTEKLFFLN